MGELNRKAKEDNHFHVVTLVNTIRHFFDSEKSKLKTGMAPNSTTLKNCTGNWTSNLNPDPNGQSQFLYL